MLTYNTPFPPPHPPPSPQPTLPHLNPYTPLLAKYIHRLKNVRTKHFHSTETPTPHPDKNKGGFSLGKKLIYSVEIRKWLGLLFWVLGFSYKNRKSWGCGFYFLKDMVLHLLREYLIVNMVLGGMRHYSVEGKTKKPKSKKRDFQRIFLDWLNTFQSKNAKNSRGILLIFFFCW